MRRLVSVDVLRAIAILLMIQVHFVYNMSPREASTAALYDLSIVFGALPAPIFTFLAGLSLWLWLRRETALGRNELALSKVTLRRGLFLFGAGLAFAVFVWLPREVFDWDILTLIGASTLILLPMRKLPPRKLIALAILVLLVSPPLRTATDYASHWQGEEYIYTFTMRDVVLGFLLQGYFPLLPWIVFPLMGFATGKHF
ncbi:MAG: heparan-alpha-glucosaminide N-acetyltransferase domain-containing protein, partial [Planctomycetota bacterium]